MDAVKNKSATEQIALIKQGAYDKIFINLYGKDKLSHASSRYISVLEEFVKLYGDMADTRLFSSPGRTELSGNHTDHNHGKALGAAVDIDIIAAAAPNDDNTVRLKSFEYSRMDIVKLSKLESMKSPEGNSHYLIGGLCKAFSDNGYKIGGFNASTQSEVIPGGGLSSSAAFELMCGTILNSLYNESKVDAFSLAKYSQYAENTFFGKPCGLLDQLCCAYGGILSIDFSGKVTVENLKFSFADYGYVLALINTKESHSDLTDEYASIPREMKAVAKMFGKEVLHDVDESEFIKAIPCIREKLGDRAVTRSFHFFNESKRVAAQTEALKNGDISTYLTLVEKSGSSSSDFLQNIYAINTPDKRALSLALALCDNENTIARVHGGGFAGTVEAYVPKEKMDEFKALTENVFGEGSCIFINIRNCGPIEVKII